MQTGDNVLMLKNNKVFNITTEEVYNKDLLPGYMKKLACKESFMAWLKLRYSSNTNTFARLLMGMQFGTGNRSKVNTMTHALSLSDCYWIKRVDEDINFEDVSPYLNKFWSGLSAYNKEAIPTLYVNGAANKRWVDSKYLLKYSGKDRVEAQCIELCKVASVPCEDIQLTDKGLLISNLTNPDVMLESLDMSGQVSQDDYTDLDFIKLFDLQAIQMLTIDAIVGNVDRHLGNIGYLRDTSTGVL